MADSEALCRILEDKLQRWGSLGEAPEYYNLKNRCARRLLLVHLPLP